MCPMSKWYSSAPIRIAEHAAHHRRRRADQGEQARPLRPRQRHRDQHLIRRYREKTSFPRTRPLPGSRARMACGRRRCTNRKSVSAWRDEPPWGGFVHAGNLRNFVRYQWRLRRLRLSSATIGRRATRDDGTLGILTGDFGIFSAMPSRCSRRAISRHTSSGRTPAAAHKTVRL